MQRVQRDHVPDEVQVSDDRSQFRDFTGLRADLPLGTHVHGGHVEHGRQADLAASSTDDARLAIEATVNL
jgi:hypothetical protein